MVNMPREYFKIKIKFKKLKMISTEYQLPALSPYMIVNVQYEDEFVCERCRQAGQDGNADSR